MSVHRYRDEAIHHVWELLTLGYNRLGDAKQLALADPQQIEKFIDEYQDLVLEIVKAAPSRREAMLRRMAKDNAMWQMALILGAWQHCRKAVLAYDWLAEHDGRFRPGQSYRTATANQGLLFSELRERKWTKWPFQWGLSPFPGEKSRRDPEDAPDFDEMMDNYDPKTGMW